MEYKILCSFHRLTVVYIYIYIYMFVCVCVCESERVCMCLWLIHLVSSLIMNTLYAINVYVLISFCFLSVETLCDAMASVSDNGLLISEFEIQWLYYVYLRTNPLSKGINLLISPALG